MDVPDSVQVCSDKYLENISDAFKTLYNEEQLSDVTIYCKEGSLKAHKLILAANSPYFCKIFRENRNDYPILILQGVSMNLMKNLIDLLYNGITDVKNDDVEALNRLIREFEIKGVNSGPKISTSNVRLERNASFGSTDSIHNKDTRFKGKKRVAVDYSHDDNLQANRTIFREQRLETDMHLSKKSNIESAPMDESNCIKREVASPAPTDSTVFSSSDITSISDRNSYTEKSGVKLTAWAKKQRKFKCDLCPSSFKRSSHLSRHQLVHTGERPYSCDQCEKAFSRHDKLKHHVRKAHEFIPDSMYERIDNDPLDSEPESIVKICESPPLNNSENGYANEYLDNPTEKNPRASPLFTISHISSILEDSFVNPPKKGRGRPRKYPTPEKKKRKSWFDSLIQENEHNRTSLRLRERKNINNNEDFMFSQMKHESNSNLICQICDKPFVYLGRLKNHMTKIHGIGNCTLTTQQEESPDLQNTKHNISTSNDEGYDVVSNTDIPSKRKRGRPKKNVSGLDVSRILAAYNLPDGIPSPSYHGISRQQLDRIQGQTIGGSVLPANPVKRGRGRPRVHASEIPGVQDYNVAHLPYGDLNYLTSQYNAHTTAEDDEESPVIMEPLVEINMDQNETNRDASTSQSQSNVLERENAVEITRIMKPIETRYVEIPEGNIKEEQTEDINSQERIDISEIENKIGLIGECTISVAN